LEAWRIGAIKSQDLEERRKEKKEQKRILREAAEMN